MYAPVIWVGSLALVFVLVTAWPLQAQKSKRAGVAEQISTITSRTKSLQDRKQAAKALKQLDRATVLEMIFPQIERLEADPDARGLFGGSSRDDEKAPPARQALTVLYELWSDCIRVPSPNQGALLLTLLKTAKTNESKSRAIHGLRFHFVPEAEAPLAAILRDINAAGWSESRWALLEHRPEKYGSVLVEYMENEKLAPFVRSAFIRDFNPKSFNRMEEKDRKRFIRVGFALIEAERKAQPKNQNAGYFPAVWIQRYLPAKLPRPDVRDPKYRKQDGNLSGAYFEDTALSALAWWKIHRQDYE